MKKISLLLAVCMILLIVTSCIGMESRFELLVQENDCTEPIVFRVRLTRFHKFAYCDVYLYGVDVSVLMYDGGSLSLEAATASDNISMYEVFGYLEDKVEPFRYLDGGSLQYSFDDYNVFVSYAVWDGDDFPDAIYFYPHGITIDEVKNNL